MSNISNLLPLINQLTASLSGSKTTPSNNADSASALNLKSTDPLAVITSLFQATGTIKTGALSNYPSLGGNQSQLLIIIILLLLIKQAENAGPKPSNFYQGHEVQTKDMQDLMAAINRPDPNKPVLNPEGITLEQLDKFIADKNNGPNKRLGKAARVLRASFEQVAFQTGDVKRVNNNDLNKFYNLDLRPDDFSSIDQVGERITNQEKQKIMKYIENNKAKLNEFGDPKGTVYAGTSQPVFVGTGPDRQVYLGGTGDKGIFMSLPAYFILRHRNWRELV